MRKKVLELDHISTEENFEYLNTDSNVNYGMKRMLDIDSREIRELYKPKE